MVGFVDDVGVDGCGFGAGGGLDGGLADLYQDLRSL